MTGRDAMLARVRDALRTPTAAVVRGPSHVAPPNERGRADAVAHATDDVPPAGPQAWLPQVGGDFESRCASFAELSDKLKTTFRRAADAGAAGSMVREIAASEGWQRVAAHRDPLVGAVVERLGLPALLTDDGYHADDLESCPASITACDALVAQTGSVLLTARSAGGRALSVLPEHHVVVARADQLVPDLPAAYRLLAGQLAGGRRPSFATLLTGPSRTGDIERILVLGAHGPKRLTVILVGDAGHFPSPSGGGTDAQRQGEGD